MRRWSRVTLIVLSILSVESALSVAPTAAASSAIALKMDVLGDSAIPGHENEVLVTAFSFANAPGGTFRCGAASVVKDIDRASPTLFLDSLRGRFHPKLQVFFLDTTAAKTPVPILTIALTNVVIAEYSLSEAAGSARTCSRPTENLTLSFERINFTNDTTGETVGWDCKADRQI